jgi:hypothetical protein
MSLFDLLELGPMQSFTIDSSSLFRRTPRRERLKMAESSGEKFLTFQDIAARWSCSRGTVRNRLRALGVVVLDFSAVGQRGKKVVKESAILAVEAKRLKRLC